jgi:hypothetical protein
MRNALVVVESMFGNTRAVADAIAEGLSTEMNVSVVTVADAPGVIRYDVDLLVVGGPTHVFGMSRANTRKAAGDQGAQPVGGTATGIREWIGGVTSDAAALPAAVFDTRVKTRGIPGSAARGAERALQKRGFASAVPPRTFYVSGTPGPLLPGELDNARSWGGQLARMRATDAHRAGTS